MATSRAILMTVGQLSFYDQVKQMLIATSVFSDNLVTHFLSSLTAVSWKIFVIKSGNDIVIHKSISS